MGAWLELAGLRPLDDPSGAEVAAFERLADELEGLGVALPRWVLWDLANVDRGPSGAGARFDSTADGRAWRGWLLRVWRPLFSSSGARGLGPLGLLPVASVVKAWSSDGAASPKESPGWDWRGGSLLLDAARAERDPRRFLGATVMREALGLSAMADPFIHPRGERLSREARVRLLGSFTTAGSDGIQRGPSGEFDRRLPGPLPDSAARIDPFDLMLARNVPDLFLQRVAESAVGQRYFKVPRPSNSVPRVLLAITVVDSVDANRFDELTGPPSSRSKLLGVRLAVAASAIAFPEGRGRRPAVDLQLRFRFEPALPGLPVESTRIPPAVQRDWSRGGLEGPIDWLTSRLSAFGSRTPVPRARRLPSVGVGHGEDDPLGWDRQVSIRIGLGGGSAASLPSEGRWDLLLDLAERVGGGWSVARPGLGVVAHHTGVDDLVAWLERSIFDSPDAGAEDGGESPVVELAP